jgi:hypothetical protein
MTLRTCPGVGCRLVNTCQRARDHGRNPLAERFELSQFTETKRVLYSEGRRAEIVEQQCDKFVEWRQQ